MSNAPALLRGGGALLGGILGQRILSAIGPCTPTDALCMEVEGNKHWALYTAILSGGAIMASGTGRPWEHLGEGFFDGMVSLAASAFLQAARQDIY